MCGHVSLASLKDGNLGTLQISCVQSEEKVKENLLECENGPTQFHAEHINVCSFNQSLYLYESSPFGFLDRLNWFVSI